MVCRAIDIAGTLDPSVTAVVMGHGRDAVAAAIGHRAEHVVQEPQLGTGHAVQVARSALECRCDVVLILFADTVLVRPETLRALVDSAYIHTVTVLTTVLKDPREYAVITRDVQGRFTGIRETKGAPNAPNGPAEINSGVMAIRADWLWRRIDSLSVQPNGERYLTELVAMAVSEGLPVNTVTTNDKDDVLGVNTQAELARVERITQRRLRSLWMERGVRMPDPSTVYIDATVGLSADCVVLPNTHLHGVTVVGAGTTIGPNSIIRDTEIGARCTVVASVLEESRVGDDVVIGPFAHLRPGSDIRDGVELGNYAEVKNSVVGAGSKIHHFSYTGDAIYGENVNVGAGTITCNYDGREKHRTVVGDDSFIGSDTMLVAPIELGKGARTGAGSVVTKNVRPGQLVVGVPARPVPGRSTPHTE